MHEGQAGRHRVAFGHDRRVPPARLGRVPRRLDHRGVCRFDPASRTPGQLHRTAAHCCHADGWRPGPRRAVRQPARLPARRVRHRAGHGADERSGRQPALHRCKPRLRAVGRGSGDPPGRWSDRRRGAGEDAHPDFPRDVRVRLRTRGARAGGEPRPGRRNSRRDSLPRDAGITEPDRGTDAGRRAPGRRAFRGKSRDRQVRLRGRGRPVRARERRCKLAPTCTRRRPNRPRTSQLQHRRNRSPRRAHRCGFATTPRTTASSWTRIT